MPFRQNKSDIYADYFVQESYNLQTASPDIRAPRVIGNHLWTSTNHELTWENTPGFRSRTNKSGPLPDHNLDQKDWDWVYPKTKGQADFYYQDGTHHRNTYTGPSSLFGANTDDFPSDHPGDDPYNKAVSRLLDQVGLSKGSAAVSLAEADKTAKHIAHTADRLVKSFLALRKGRLGDFAEILGLATKNSEIRAFGNRWKRKRTQGLDMRQFAANSWLEYSYGWKPLIKDTFDLAENLSETFTKYDGVVRIVKASAKTVRDYREEWFSGAYRDWFNRRDTKITNRVRLTVRYAVPDGANSYANVFGLLNPLSVAWELIPYSFVADWFLPIGDFLNGLTAYNGLVFHGGTIQRVRKTAMTCNTVAGKAGSAPGVWPVVVTDMTPAMSYNYGTYKNRTLLTDFPRPQLQFTDPRSFAHAASAIALLQSTFLGSRSGTVSYRR